MTNFIRDTTPSGAKMWIASVVRSQLDDADMQVMIHDGPRGFAPLWWGPMAPVQPRSRVIYFVTPFGLMVEGVEAPAARAGDPAPRLQGHTTTMRLGAGGAPGGEPT